MKRLVEVHILQNFSPSLLNRDDTGSPKDCEFGGFRRSRISSQCLKRAVRQFVRQNNLVDDSQLAVRTKRLVEDVSGRLSSRPAGEVEVAVGRALGGLSLALAEGGKTQYLLFLGESEIANLVQLIETNWDQLVAPAEAAADEGKKKSKKDEKKAGRASLPQDLIKQLEAILDGGKAVDLALFGRMLADLPSKNIDAACQVAHAISTNAVTREFDFYTAVDDLRPDDTQGADMMGQVEFNSACYYRYAVLDLDKLAENLQNDELLAHKAVEAFLRGFVLAMPTGKQNSFAAHNLPAFVAFTVRENALPRSLANAFERPVRPDQARSLTVVSIGRLVDEWMNLDAIYGQAGATAIVALEPDVLKGMEKDRRASFEAALNAAMDSVRQAIPAKG